MRNLRYCYHAIYWQTNIRKTTQEKAKKKMDFNLNEPTKAAHLKSKLECVSNFLSWNENKSKRKWITSLEPNKSIKDWKVDCKPTQDECRPVLKSSDVDRIKNEHPVAQVEFKKRKHKMKTNRNSSSVISTHKNTQGRQQNRKEMGKRDRLITENVNVNALWEDKQNAIERST